MVDDITYNKETDQSVSKITPNFQPLWAIPFLGVQTNERPYDMLVNIQLLNVKFTPIFLH